MNIFDNLKAYVGYLPIALAIILIFNWFSACNIQKNSSRETNCHPVLSRFFLDKTECDKIKSDECIIVGIDLFSIKFHVAAKQRYISPSNINNQELKNDPKDLQNYVEQIYYPQDNNPDLNKRFHWFMTPNTYGIWSHEPGENSALKINTLIEHNFNIPNKSPKKGVTLEVINALLHTIDKESYDSKEIVIIIGTGITGELGISEEAKTALEKWKESKKIGDYEIDHSDEAAKKHNNHVKKNKKVFTLLSLCC